MSCNDIEPKCHPKPARYVSPFWGFTEFTPTIPKLYWNVRSQEQRILRICDMLDRLICYSDYLGDKVQINKDDIEWLKSEFEEFKEHGFDDYYAAQIEQWVNDHLETLYHLLVKQVFFGLTLDGHFVAYIPDSWEDIAFDTGMVYELDTYGRLILRWNVDGNTVDQTPEIVRPSSQYSQLYSYIRNIMNTLYNPDF